MDRDKQRAAGAQLQRLYRRHDLARDGAVKTRGRFVQKNAASGTHAGEEETRLKHKLLTCRCIQQQHAPTRLGDEAARHARALALAAAEAAHEARADARVARQREPHRSNDLLHARRLVGGAHRARQLHLRGECERLRHGGPAHERVVLLDVCRIALQLRPRRNHAIIQHAAAKLALVFALRRHVQQCCFACSRAALPASSSDQSTALPPRTNCIALCAHFVRMCQRTIRAYMLPPGITPVMFLSSTRSAGAPAATCLRLRASGMATLTPSNAMVAPRGCVQQAPTVCRVAPATSSAGGMPAAMLTAAAHSRSSCASRRGDDASTFVAASAPAAIPPSPCIAPAQGSPRNSVVADRRGARRARGARVRVLPEPREVQHREARRALSLSLLQTSRSQKKHIYGASSTTQSSSTCATNNKGKQVCAPAAQTSDSARKCVHSRAERAHYGELIRSLSSAFPLPQLHATAHAAACGRGAAAGCSAAHACAGAGRCRSALRTGPASGACA